MEYIFTLKYRLSRIDSQLDNIVDRLGEGGCDDALIGIGLPGRVALEFTREAPSAEIALISALSDVKRAMPTAQLIEAAPDFVGLTDVAEVVGVSRQNLHKLMVSHKENFPLPIHDGSTAMWHLADMLDWLKDNVAYQLEPTTLDIAKTTRQINLAKQVLQLSPKLNQQVQALIA